MNRQQQIELMRRSFAHLASKTTDLAPTVHRHPTASYTSQQQLAAEIDLLFRDRPLLIGLSCQIPKPGDFLTEDNAGVPLLIVRGQDGLARAFHNVCRHRGARVAEGCGQQSNFRCPYHGWTYGLDGSLRGIPDKRSFPGVEPGDHGLVPLPMAERHGLLWVTPRATPQGLALDAQAHLGELDSEFAAYGLQQYHHFETREIRRQMNWKMVIDTFLEPYHLGSLHRDTVGPLFIDNQCLFDAFGPHLREALPRSSLVTQRDRPESEWDAIAHHTLVYVLFPNTVFVMQVDHAETWRVFPVAGRPDECVMKLDFFVPNPIDSASARGHWERNMDLTLRTVCGEDFPTGEGMQRGYACAAQSHVTFGRNEPALIHFQRMVTEAVTAAGLATV